MARRARRLAASVFPALISSPLFPHPYSLTLIPSPWLLALVQGLVSLPCLLALVPGFGSSVPIAFLSLFSAPLAFAFSHDATFHVIGRLKFLRAVKRGG